MRKSIANGWCGWGGETFIAGSTTLRPYRDGMNPNYAFCPGCGKRVKLRAHMVGQHYVMIPLHKRPRLQENVSK